MNDNSMVDVRHPARASQNRALTLEARGLLSELLDRHTPEPFQLADLYQEHAGRDKIRRIMTELTDAGYVRREQSRIDGKFGPVLFAVFEAPPVDTPETYAPSPEIPVTVEETPLTDPPSPENTVTVESPSRLDGDSRGEPDNPKDIDEGKAMPPSAKSTKEPPPTVNPATVECIESLESSDNSDVTNNTNIQKQLHTATADENGGDNVENETNVDPRTSLKHLTACTCAAFNNFNWGWMTTRAKVLTGQIEEPKDINQPGENWTWRFSEDNDKHPIAPMTDAEIIAFGAMKKRQQSETCIALYRYRIATIHEHVQQFRGDPGYQELCNRADEEIKAIMDSTNAGTNRDTALKGLVKTLADPAPTRPEHQRVEPKVPPEVMRERAEGARQIIRELYELKRAGRPIPGENLDDL